MGGWVEITDAKKKSLPANIPYPAGIKKEEKKEILKPAEQENVEVSEKKTEESDIPNDTNKKN